jgi:hypoxanthine phosphoribosyltransferase
LFIYSKLTFYFSYAKPIFHFLLQKTTDPAGFVHLRLACFNKMPFVSQVFVFLYVNSLIREEMKNIRIHDKEFKLFISSAKIKRAVDRMAKELNKDLKGKDVIFLGVLNGCFIFAADLFRKLTIPCEISFTKISSYVSNGSSGETHDLIGINEDLRNKTVVILEDIIDTGITIEHILSVVKSYNPAEVKIVTMFFKPDSCKPGFNPDYVGMEIPARFILGYGLDYDRLGRNFEDIYIEV